MSDGKVDFWISELPAGTYQVKVSVGSVSGTASKFVTVSSDVQPPLTVGKVSNFTATSKDREIVLTWSALEGVYGYEIWYKLSDSDSWIRGWSEQTAGVEGTSSTPSFDGDQTPPTQDADLQAAQEKVNAATATITDGKYVLTGADVTWAVKYGAAVADGDSAPAATAQDQEITLVATATVNGKTATKEFKVTVPAQQDDTNEDALFMVSADGGKVTLTFATAVEANTKIIGVFGDAAVEGTVGNSEGTLEFTLTDPKNAFEANDVITITIYNDTDAKKYKATLDEKGVWTVIEVQVQGTFTGATFENNQMKFSITTDIRNK